MGSFLRAYLSTVRARSASRREIRSLRDTVQFLAASMRSIEARSSLELAADHRGSTRSRLTSRVATYALFRHPGRASRTTPNGDASSARAKRYGRASATTKILASAAAVSNVVLRR